MSNNINAKNFSFGIMQASIVNGKQTFAVENCAETFFAQKQIQNNLGRAFGIKQANRNAISRQLKSVLSDDFPKYVIRTDIASFFESISIELMLKKLKMNTMLDFFSVDLIQRLLGQFGSLDGADGVGVPRGIGVSAYLAEAFMQDFDKTIRHHPGVVYYARYVDDIIICYCPPPNTGIFSFCRIFVKLLRDLRLTTNLKKTKILNTRKTENFVLEFLGYKYDVTKNKVNVGISRKKEKRYRQRINLSFRDYLKQSQGCRKKERRARALLEKRVRLLTGNTILRSSTKDLIIGTYFSSPMMNDFSDLESLDSHLKRQLSSIKASRLKKRLGELSFTDGFKNRKFYMLSNKDIRDIVKIWKYDS